MQTYHSFWGKVIEGTVANVADLCPFEVLIDECSYQGNSFLACNFTSHSRVSG